MSQTTAKRLNPLDDVRVYECWMEFAPRAMAELLCERYLAWRQPAGQQYTVVDFPEAPVVSLIVSGATVRETFERIANLAGGGVVVDSARRVLYCAREGVA